MNQMKLIFLACLIAFTVNAQSDYTQSLEGIKWVNIESKSQIVVKTHTGNQLLIKGKIMQQTPVKAKGLKLVGDRGMDNTNIGFYVIKEGSNLLVRNLRNTNGDKAEIFLPASQNIKVKSDGLNNIEISGFTAEVEASAEMVGNITITNVTGPVTANANTGNVEIIFTKVSQSLPITISTATGDVDVTLPNDTPADLVLDSTMGEIYTNFDLKVPDKDGLQAISAQKVKGSINNGGVKIQLNSATGNIYLRKK